MSERLPNDLQPWRDDPDPDVDPKTDPGPKEPGRRGEVDPKQKS